MRFLNQIQDEHEKILDELQKENDTQQLFIIFCQPYKTVTPRKSLVTSKERLHTGSCILVGHVREKLFFHQSNCSVRSDHVFLLFTFSVKRDA